MRAYFKKYLLEFKRPSGTSRGVLKTKETFFLFLEKEGKVGVGECGIFRGLSADDVPEYEKVLEWTCLHIHLGLNQLLNELKKFPSIQFGLEQAFLSLQHSNKYHLFQNNFLTKHKPIPINGLIWMGDAEFMQNQIEEKLQQGFQTIKIKIGAIDFEKECALLDSIRSRFSASQIEIRVDANGAFTPENALEKLEKLASYQLHSIEQPIKQGQTDAMAGLCRKTKLPIALDEELIGVFDYHEKKELLEKIKPQFIILKPSLVGGFAGSLEWIQLAKQYDIDWWITSALESNIGLNAIAQFTSDLEVTMPQGLGTGGLFTNNIDAPLYVENGNLWYDSDDKWNDDFLQNLI